MVRRHLAGSLPSRAVSIAGRDSSATTGHARRQPNLSGKGCGKQSATAQGVGTSSGRRSFFWSALVHNGVRQGPRARPLAPSFGWLAFGPFSSGFTIHGQALTA
eukprot:2389799-Amphidinium_carterae.1